MAYIGNTPEVQNFVAGADKFSGDGTNTTFVLSRKIPTNFDVIPVVENVIQDPFIAYSLSANTTSGATDIVFSSAPPTGIDNIVVNYRATQIVSLDNSINDSLYVNGNLQIQGTGRRILGDFSNATIANRVMFQTSTVNGNTQVRAIPNGTSGVASLQVGSSNDPNNQSIFALQIADNLAQISSSINGTGTVFPITFLTGGTERVRIDTSGNVGIGTSSPTQRLEVSSAVVGVSTPVRISNSSATTNGRGAGLEFFGASNTFGRIEGFWDGADDQIRLFSTGSMTFSTAATERMRINSAGNVGIGITPTQKLHVSGNILATGSIDCGTQFLGLSTDSATAPSFSFTGDTNTGLFSPGADQAAITTGGTARLTVTTAQFTGTLPWRGQNGTAAAPALSASGDTNTGIFFPAADTLAFTEGGAEAMRIDSSGNLLVGTTSDTGMITVRSDSTTSGRRLLQVRTNNGTEVAVMFQSGAVFLPTTAAFTTGSGANMVIATDGQLFRSTSSLKYKTDVQDTSHGLAEVMALRPVTYKGKTDGDKVFGGLIAEEVHDVGLTEFVQYAQDGTPDALHYGNMVSLAFKAIQEQQAIIEQLKTRIENLEYQ
jgi:hypothetical protein